MSSGISQRRLVNSGTGDRRGRSRLFKELGCVQCHRFAVPAGAGPDLTGVAKKRTPQELLESIVDPSKQIAPEFASTIIVTSSGKTIEGRIAKEDDKEVVIHSAGALASGSPFARMRSKTASCRQLRQCRLGFLTRLRCRRFWISWPILCRRPIRSMRCIRTDSVNSRH